MTKEEFILIGNDYFPNMYDYSLLPEKINQNKKYKIICKEHGVFEIRADVFVRGRGCPECSRLNRYKTTEEFIKQAQQIHQNPDGNPKYLYKKTKYIHSRKPVIITCPIHGDFEQLASNHLSGQNCPFCAGKVTNTKYFIEQAKKIHDDKYDYSKVNYVNATTPVTIICPVHGEFEQLPNNHLHTFGCKKCSFEKGLFDNKENFIEQAKKIHGDKYDYSKVNYVNATTPVTIICPVHGEFEQLPNNHLRTNGCPYCSERASNTEIFIQKSITIHKNPEGIPKYDYSKVNYVNATTPVTIICPIHGEFEQLPNNHLNGKGCPQCAFINGASRGEKEIVEFLKSLNI